MTTNFLFPNDINYLLIYIPFTSVKINAISYAENWNRHNEHEVVASDKASRSDRISIGSFLLINISCMQQFVAKDCKQKNAKSKNRLRALLYVQRKIHFPIKEMLLRKSQTLTCANSLLRFSFTSNRLMDKNVQSKS